MQAYGIENIVACEHGSEVIITIIIIIVTITIIQMNDPFKVFGG